jgi:hypothetical protein
MAADFAETTVESAEAFSEESTAEPADQDAAYAAPDASDSLKAPMADAASRAAEAETALKDEADTWVAHGNVVFACVVYLTPEEAGSALESYEGRPYSDADDPEAGIIGTGYALDQAELREVLSATLGEDTMPALDPDRTTELCCIVVTENGDRP